MEQGCQITRYLANEAGRDPDSLELAKVIYLSIDDDRARARRRIGPLLETYYHGYNVDSWCAFGPPPECAAFIKGFLDIGITTVMLCPVRPDLEQLERLHREVVPLLGALMTVRTSPREVGSTGQSPTWSPPGPAPLVLAH